MDAKINGNVCLSSMIRGLRPRGGPVAATRAAALAALAAGAVLEEDEYVRFRAPTAPNGRVRYYSHLIVGFVAPDAQAGIESIRVGFKDREFMTIRLVRGRTEMTASEVIPIAWLPFEDIDIVPRGIYQVEYALLHNRVFRRTVEDSARTDMGRFARPDLGWYDRLYDHPDVTAERDKSATAIQRGYHRLVRRKAATNIQRVYRGMMGRREATALRYAPGGPGARQAEVDFVCCLALVSDNPLHHRDIA